MGIASNLQHNSTQFQHNSNTHEALQHSQTGFNEALEQLRANPSNAIKNAGMNIPDGMNDPQQIINHLLQTGQIGNNRFQAAVQFLRRLGFIR